MVNRLLSEWTVFCTFQKLIICDFVCLCSSSPAPAPSPFQVQLQQPVDPVDRRDWEDYGMEADGPDSPHASDDIDLALAALMKGMQEIAADD